MDLTETIHFCDPPRRLTAHYSEYEMIAQRYPSSPETERASFCGGRSGSVERNIGTRQEMSRLHELVAEKEKEISELREQVSKQESTVAAANSHDISQSKEIHKLHVQLNELGKELAETKEMLDKRTKELRESKEIAEKRSQELTRLQSMIRAVLDSNFEVLKGLLC